jgi:2-methylcitrate dehydratase PrpD
MTLARELVQALRALSRRSLPPEVVQAATLHFVDALGVGLAASTSRSGEWWYQAGRQWAHGGVATVLGQSAGASAADAAMVNGGLIHSLEFDDTHTGSIMHGSAVVATAALAAAEASDASVGAMLAAYARGYEALILLGLAAPGRFHATGFQATSVAGTLAAALVAAELQSLSEDQTVAALGIALSQSSGVMEFLSNGSSVKSLNPGWAAHGGLIAANLAACGMTGPETSLDGRWGLFAQFSDDAGAAERLRGLLSNRGNQWLMPDAAFKFYPCCHYLHSFIEAAGELSDSGVAAQSISEILCEVPAGAAPVICEPWGQVLDPATGHAARWSLPITVAMRFVEGKVDLSSFEQPASPAVRALAQRVRWQPLANARFPERFEALVRCTMADGSERSIRIDDVDGNPSRPASPERVLSKFRDNAGRVLDTEVVQEVASRMCDSSRHASSARALGQALRHSYGPRPDIHDSSVSGA